MVADVTLRRRLEREVIAAMDRAVVQEIRWGVDDCTLWAVEPVRRVLGYDPAAKGRGHYRTRKGAARVLGKAGLAGAMRSAARRHGWKRIDPKEARPGDLGLVLINDAYSMTVCRSRGWFVVRADGGYVAVAAAQQKIAFRVV
jgi:hypothetical protein